MSTPRLLDKQSAPSAQTELLLFQVPATQVAIQKSSIHVVNPQNTLDNYPIVLKLPSQPGLIDFARSMLYCKFKITRQNNNDLQSAPVPAQQQAPAGAPIDFVGPINYLGSTFFSQMRFYANNRLLYDSQNTFHYKSYIETLLGESEDVKASVLASGLWHADGHGDNAEAVGGNIGLVARNEAGWDSREFETMSPIHCELFSQERFLPNMCEYKLEMFRNGQNLVLMTDRAHHYILRLLQCQFFVRVVDVTPSLALAFEKQLKKTPAKIPIRKVRD
jgi:hypothetical protein